MTAIIIMLVCLYECVSYKCNENTWNIFTVDDDVNSIIENSVY